MGWLREVLRDPVGFSSGDGVWVCAYCGERVYRQVKSGPSPERAMRAHYAQRWRWHAAITRGRRRV